MKTLLQDCGNSSKVTINKRVLPEIALLGQNDGNLKKVLWHSPQDQATKTPGSNPPKCLEIGEASEQAEGTCDDSRLHEVSNNPRQTSETLKPLARLGSRKGWVSQEPSANLVIA